MYLKTLRFQSTVSDSEPINDLLTRVKIHVAYEGLNRNNSYIQKETFDKASYSAKYCPIIGEWSESIEDFQGHGGKIEITDDGVKFVNTTLPYGLIGVEEPYWEIVEQSDGTSKEYYTLTGYLWTGRYPELEGFTSKSQSMEISITDGEYQKINNEKVYVIKDMVFNGFCILGNDVEPCFEDSTIMTYSLDKDEFKKQFNQMIKELKFSLENEPVQKEDDDSIESKNVSEFDAEGGKEMPEKDKKPEVKDPEVFALSHEQIESELRRELSQFKTVDDWGYSYSHYYLIDFLPDQNIAIAYDCQEGYMVGVNFNVNGDVVSLDIESKQRYKVDYVPMEVAQESDDEFSLVPKEYVEYQLNVKEKEVESKLKTEYDAKIENYENDLNTIKEEFEVIKQEKDELANFKANKLQEERESEESAIFEKFSKELTEDEIKDVKDKASEYSLEEIEDKLFALVGRKEVKFSLSKKKERISIGAFDLDDDSKAQKDIWAEKKEELSSNK